MEREVEFCDVNHPAIAFLGSYCPICEKKLWPNARGAGMTDRIPAIRGYVPDLKRALAAEFSTAFIDKVFKPLDRKLHQAASAFERRLLESQRSGNTLPRPRFEDYE